MKPPLDQLGRPWRDLRISVTDRCNHRCVFCMPAGRSYTFLPRKSLLSFEEIFRIARTFVREGVRKIRISGGEPLLRKHLENLIAQLNTLRAEGLEDLALTTNGILLAKKAEALRKAGLDRVTVSLHTTDPNLFQQITHSTLGLNAVLEGLQAAKEVGFSPIKVNAVPLRKLNSSEILALAEFCRREGFVLRFIEYMDAGTAHAWDFKEVFTAQEILKLLESRYQLEPVSPAYRGEVAQRYRYRDMDLEVGIIASVTQPFCRDCTRVRLSADGKLYTCLFAASGYDLRPLLRSSLSEEKLLQELVRIWKSRRDRYSEERQHHFRPFKTEMFRLGG